MALLLGNLPVPYAIAAIRRSRLILWDRRCPYSAKPVQWLRQFQLQAFHRSVFFQPRRTSTTRSAVSSQETLPAQYSFCMRIGKRFTWITLCCLLQKVVLQWLTFEFTLGQTYLITKYNKPHFLYILSIICIGSLLICIIHCTWVFNTSYIRFKILHSEYNHFSSILIGLHSPLIFRPL